ncbi:helix-turn-helix transcriptional regulator [Kordia sp.]|uniref:helix-turn-helix domain-containing protein n=1 Tax=Kordia sp. TaxID=1965332 RepID=UPI0025BE2684|nr:helix-turn-helix transcriptional regulator [Kordia sp.]MCH2194645.1 helix-turn-helix transcriptional regulator [Kordia sp.]
MKELNQITRLMVFVLIFLFPNACVFGHNLDTPIHQTEFTKLSKTASKKSPYFYDAGNQKMKSSSTDSISIYKELALQHARNRDLEQMTVSVDTYIKMSHDINFVHASEFSAFKHVAPFQKIFKKYSLNFTAYNLFYLFSALIGFFIAIVMNFKRNKNRNAIIFISIFILIRSLFILHLFLYDSNLKYRFPHALFMSTLFVFVDGPLLYFYFKSITKKYVFKKQHLLHLVPTIVIMTVLLPILVLPEEEKLKVMLYTSTIDYKSFLPPMVFVKLTLLFGYGYFVYKIYYKDIHKNSEISERVQKWQRNLMGLITLYILSFTFYCLTVIRIIPKSEFLYHFQIWVMTSMVLYIGFMAYIQPKIITNSYVIRINSKYRNSGLTESLSQELKEQLLYLLNEEKIYKQNDINLEKLSKKLNTTRHNTSQVINEHFELNFFELINQYRITEASQILKNDIHHNLNIIDVAYEVGFNNKVTFNKSFKKHFAQTPTQYVKMYRVA